MVFLSWYSYSSNEMGVVSQGRSRFDSFDRMDHSFDRQGRMDVANPTFEEMARQWFDTLELTSVLSHLLALALGFELQVGG
jgi:hypothetical protein